MVALRFWTMLHTMSARPHFSNTYLFGSSRNVRVWCPAVALWVPMNTHRVSNFRAKIYGKGATLTTKLCCTSNRPSWQYKVLDLCKNTWDTCLFIDLVETLDVSTEGAIWNNWIFGVLHWSSCLHFTLLWLNIEVTSLYGAPGSLNLVCGRE